MAGTQQVPVMSEKQVKAITFLFVCLTSQQQLSLGIFLGLFWGRTSARYQSKIEQKLPTIVNNIPNSLALQFGDYFMKIRTKIAFLQIMRCLHSHIDAYICEQLYMSVDLTKGSFGQFSRFCVIKISKTSKFSRFCMFLQ